MWELLFADYFATVVETPRELQRGYLVWKEMEIGRVVDDEQ